MRWNIEAGPEIGKGACGVIVRGPEDTTLDITDSAGWKDADEATLRLLVADANAAEVYRKALEPFARGFADKVRRRGLPAGNEGMGVSATARREPFSEGDWSDVGLAEMLDACRLMGITFPEEDGKGSNPD